jgi:dienelactone hydrolase
MKFLIILILTFSAVIAKANDVESSWNKAQVFVPGNTLPVTVNDIKSNQNYPVVVYLHGCTGIVNWHDHDWGVTLSGSGFIVIMLDSMARDGRIPNCDPVAKTGGLFPQAHDYRQQEITYAL